jgi:hypothetical protein
VHAVDTPAEQLGEDEQPLRRTAVICGWNCGTANAVATTGSQSSTSATEPCDLHG